MHPMRIERFEEARSYPIRTFKNSSFKIVVIFLFIPFLLFPFAKQNIEVLEKQLQAPGISREENISLTVQICEYTRDREPLKTIEYGKKALDFLQETNNPLLEVRVLLALTRASQHSGDYQTARKYGQQAGTIALQNKMPKWAAIAYNEISRICLFLGFLDRSLDYALRALESCEDTEDYKNIAGAYTNIGNIYKTIGDNKSALEHYNYSHFISKELGDKKNKAEVLLLIGSIYHASRRFDKAEKSYRDTLDIAGELDWNIGQAAALMRIAALLADKGNPDQAIVYNKKALVICKKIGLKRNIAVIYGHISLCQRKLGQYNTALLYVNRALDIAKKIKNKDIIVIFYFELYNIYGAMKDYEQAYAFFNKAKTIKDEIFSEESRENIAELWRKYKTGIKGEKILQLIQDNTIQQFELERQELVRNFLISLSLLTLILAGVIYNRYRIKKRTERLLKESELKLRAMNTAKDKLFSIIAHDLESPLNGLLLSTGYLKKNYHLLEEKEASEFLDHIYENAGHMAKLLDNLLQWAVSQLGKLEVENEVFDISRLTGETIALINPAAAEKSIRLFSHIQDNTLVRADKRMVETIMRNLVSNAVKYSHNGGEVHIASVSYGNYLEVTVSDNGIGIPGDKLDTLFDPNVYNSTRGTAGERGIGLGLVLCKEFVEKNEGTIKAEKNMSNATHSGTRIVFTLPAGCTPTSAAPGKTMSNKNEKQI